jgi:hypothetical protein
LLQYEFLVLGAALAWLGRRLLRLRPVEQFLGIAGVGSIVMYCYLGEKVPWLGVHQVWPFVPLAGAQLARTMGERGRWWSRALAVSGLGATVLVSLVANFSLHEITPRQRRVESLHFVQTCPELQQVVADGLEYGAEGGLVAAVSGEAAWPLTWYWRDLPVFWAKPGNGSRPPLVVCDPEDESEVFEVLGPEYARERIPLRAWWLMYQWPSPAVGILEWLRGGEDRGSVFDVRGAAVARYFLTRIPWGVVGSTDVIVFRRRDGSAPSTRLAPVPEAVQQELGFTSARVVGEGWLAEPRGIDLVGQRLVAADVALSRIARVDHEGSVRAVELGGLLQPEAVAWRGDRALVVADTWNHRVVVAELGEDGLTELPAPEGGWYGPRAVAVGPGGQIAVADTGHKQVVLYDGDLALAGVLQAEAAGGLDEPGGVAWVDADSLLVCDTGNRRVLVLGVGGEVEQEVAIPRAWADYYSRPQATVLGARQWLVSDTPGSALWLVRDGVPVRLGLEVSGLAPTGLAWDAASGTLAVADLRSGVWLFEREGEGRDDDQ